MYSTNKFPKLKVFQLGTQLLLVILIIDVVDFLRRFGFPETKSEELGMALDIDPKYWTEFKSLTECLGRWIDENIHSEKPLFVSLSRALRSVNEDAIADKLDQESELIFLCN